MFTGCLDMINYNIYKVPEKSLTISGITLIFISLLYVIWKMLATEQRYKRPNLETQWTALCWGSKTVSSILPSELQREQPFRSLGNKFQRTGNVCDEKLSARSSTSQETVQTIWQAIEQSPKASTHRFSREHGIPKSIVWQTLRFVLKKKAYHIQVLGLTHQRI